MKHARGFTLIEILVVVVIVGLLAVGAVLAIGTGKRDDALETEARRLESLIDYVREHAELTTHEFGLRCEGDRYEFLAFDARRGLWKVAEADDVLRERTLPVGLRIRLRIEGREVLLRPPKDTEPLLPQVMLFSNGDVTPFELTLGREGSTLQAVLASDDEGIVKLELPDGEARS
jgi:general secretion pathway protein H